MHYQGTEWAWLDNSAAMGGKAWLNPVNEYAQSYISDLAAEAVGKGVKQVILDCVQFPSRLFAGDGGLRAGAHRGE